MTPTTYVARYGAIVSVGACKAFYSPVSRLTYSDAHIYQHIGDAESCTLALANWSIMIGKE